MRPSHKVGMALAVVGVLAATAALIWTQHPSRPKETPLVVADVSGRPTACLAADTEPTTRDEVARIWAAMHAGAAGKRVDVQQLIVPVTTSKQAQPYLAGLLAQHCDLIVTVGPRFGNAIPTQLAAAPDTSFTAVDADGLKSTGNLTVLASSTAPAHVESSVRTLHRTASS